jgi:hypothetical protein
MTERTLIVAANAYTRAHIASAVNGVRHVTTNWRSLELVALLRMDGLPASEAMFLDGRSETPYATFRFVTNNDLDDGVFRVVGED